MAVAKEYSDDFARDIAKNITRDGNVINEDAISQSIEMIIATTPGERLFKPEFGTLTWATLFEDFTVAGGERLIDDIVAAIRKYEDRVEVLESDITLQMNQNENSMLLSIPYVIKRNGKVSRFDKKIFV
jgi:phage baseplate assembly protein W